MRVNIGCCTYCAVTKPNVIMTTIDKLIDSIANICINLGLRGEYSPEEIADLVCDIEFVHLYDALRDLAEPVYAFSTDGERPMTLKYRSRKLFDRNATLLSVSLFCVRMTQSWHPAGIWSCGCWKI